MGRFRSLLDNNPHKFKQWTLDSAEVEGSGAIDVLQGPPLALHEIRTARLQEKGFHNHYVITRFRVVETVAAGSTIEIRLNVMLTHHAPIVSRLLVQICSESEETFTTVGKEIERVPSGEIVVNVKGFSGFNCLGEWVVKLRVRMIERVSLLTFITLANTSGGTFRILQPINRGHASRKWPQGRWCFRGESANEDSQW